MNSTQLIRNESKPIDTKSHDKKISTLGDSNQLLRQFFKILNLFLLTFSHWWKLAIPFGIVTAASVSIVVWCSTTPSYTSVAKLRIKENQPYIAFESREHSGRFVRTQLQLFQTDAVLLPAVEKLANTVPSLMAIADPVNHIRLKLNVSEIAHSELILAAYTDLDSKTAQRVLSAIIDEYLAYHDRYKRNIHRDVITALQKEQETRDATVKHLQNEVRDGSKNNIASSKRSVDQERSPVDAVQELLIQTEVDLEVLKAELHVADNTEAFQIDISSTDLKSIVDSHPEIIQIAEAIDLMRDHVNRIEKTRKKPEGSTKYLDAKSELKKYTQKLAETRARISKKTQDDLAHRASHMHQLKLRDLRQKMDSKTAVREHLIARLQKEIESQIDSNESLVDIEFLRRKLEREEGVFERISNRIVSLQTEQFAPARVELVDAANLPVIGESKRWLMLPAATFVAFLCPLCLFMVWEFIANRVNDEDFSTDNDLPVIGEIAKQDTYLRSFGGNSKKGRSLFEESVDNLLGYIRLSPRFAGKKIIAITSPNSNEGKTHVSSQMAIGLAQSCQSKILLVEADLRSPDIARNFGIEESGPGLVDVLSRSCKLKEVIHSSGHPHLDVVLAGGPAFNVQELVQADDIEKIFDEFRKCYSYVIIDTSPILSTGESLFFSSLADSVLLCAMKGVSRVPQIRKAQMNLARVNAVTDGVILNGISKIHYHYSYGKYEIDAQRSNK